MTDYRNLPDDVKRELVFDALKFTKACVALSHITDNSAEIWGERCGNAAYAEMQQMTQPEIDAAIETIEAARRGSYGTRMQRVDIKPKGFGDAKR